MWMVKLPDCAVSGSANANRPQTSFIQLVSPEPVVPVRLLAWTDKIKNSMSRVEKIENEIRQLSSDELSVLRRWFSEFDALDWDRKFENDVGSGKLDRL